MIFVNDNLFGYMPNWKNEITIKYRVETVLSKTRKLKEQRKPLMDTLKRRMNVEYLREEVDPIIIENFFKYYRTDGFYVPVYSEPIAIDETGSLLGKSSLNIENAQYYYSYKNLTNMIMLYDLSKQIQVEKIAVSSISDTVVSLSTNVSKNYTGETTMLFPVMKCLLDAKTFNNITDRLKTIILDFGELI